MIINKNWKPKEFRTGIINPATGKEWILSSYYEDKKGNRHFTHAEALKIAEKVAEKYPGWRMCDDDFHRALRNKVWDNDADSWQTNVNGFDLNGLECMTRKLGYIREGFRYHGSWSLYYTKQFGYVWSSAILPDKRDEANSLHFGSNLCLQHSPFGRKYGLQLRFIKC